MQCPVPLGPRKQRSVATAISQNIKPRKTCFIGATRYVSVGQRFPFPVSCCSLYRKDALMDGWARCSFFTCTAKYKLIRTARTRTHTHTHTHTHNFSYEFNTNRYTKLRATEGSSGQPLCSDAAQHKNKLKPKTYLSKAVFLPVYIRCLNEHLLQRELHRFMLKTAHYTKM